MGSISQDVKLPTLDASKWFHGSDGQRQEFADEFLKCIQRHGFAKLVNHGISDEDMRELYRWNREFFTLPEESKAKIVHKPTALQPQRGWSHVGVERSAKLNWGRTGEGKGAGNHQGLKDAKEHLDLGAPDDEEYKNQWPPEEELPGFRQCIEKQYLACRNVSIELLAALELGLKLPPAYLSSKLVGKASELRLSHYPSISVADMERGDTSRIWPHTDLGVLTCLFQDDVGGLEIEDRDHRGTFFPVPRESWNEMIINVSETLERWTNGELPAGVHQVTVPSHLKGKEGGVLPSRYSVAFFAKADRNEDVGVLPQFLANGQERRYESMTALQFHLHRLTTAY